MGNITKKQRSQNAQSKEEMRKKISVTKALTRIALCEKELLKQCSDIAGSTVSALKAVIDSNWKKIDKHLPNPQSVEVTGEVVHKDAAELTDEELDRRITEARERIAQLDGGAEKSEGSERITH